MKKNKSQRKPNYRELILETIKKKPKDLLLGVIIFFLVAPPLIISVTRNFNQEKVSPPQSAKTKKTQIQAQKKDQPSKSKIYIVQPGDDLWGIAQRFYGSGYRAYDIAKANNLNQDLPLFVGQELVLPDLPSLAEAGLNFSIKAKKIKYVVQPGESLSSIALKFYGDLFAWPKIAEANNITFPDNLEVGTELIIP
ncbi:MAG: LysM peptidoglycan-binding domain-containing protein [Patescibacteria group bacterium]|nr:LysM peptidoglycan-binding domain-containing protein [Patescibacteria group bacterium]